MSRSLQFESALSLKHICHVFKLLCVFIILFVNFTTATADEKKFALIIGNSEYQHASQLANPMNDAIDISEVLRTLGFDVDIHVNATHEQMQNAAKAFIKNLDETKGIGLFFYAGHGTQLEGINYLMPVEANIAEQSEIQNKGFDVAKLLNNMRVANNQTNIIILDACRDNPFSTRASQGQRSMADKPTKASDNNQSRGLVPATKVVSSGLSKLDAPPNTLIAFATAPGRTADDGHARNSPYTRELLNTLQQEGLSVEQVFKTVRNNVITSSKGKQVPWESSSLVKEFYFKPRKTIPMGW